MKASVILTTWEKNKVLPNVLESLKRQKTSFPFEICVFDDCSSEDPGSIVNTFLPEAKYKRTLNRLGGRQSRAEAIKMIDSKSEIVVLSSSEIIFLQPNILDEMCKQVEPSKVINIAVKDLHTDLDFYKDFESNANTYLEKWNSYKNVYSGPSRSGNWLFVCALTREDFYKLEWDVNCCDRINQFIFQEKGIKIKNLWNLKAIHQSHLSYRHSCPSLKTCRFAHIGKEKWGNCK